MESRIQTTRALTLLAVRQFEITRERPARRGPVRPKTLDRLVATAQAAKQRRGTTVQ